MMALLLIIEEEPDTRTLVERVFKRWGVQVVSFSKARDAIDWLKRNTPDLAIVSTGNHGEKAESLLNSLRDAGLEGGHIVLSAGVGSLSFVRRRFANHVRGVMVKPSDLESLEALISSMIPF